MKKLVNIFIGFLPYVFIFLASIFQPSDADLGWHLKYGEYFYQHLKPLTTNTFSTMMPGFHWTNSSWVMDVFSYSLFKMGGFIGLSLASAAVITLTFFFISKAFKLRFLEEAVFFPILFYLLLPVNNVSLRGQQVSLLFLALLLFLLETKDKTIVRKNLKRFFLIPFLFFVWVNTHGEFLLGLGVLGLYAGGDFLQNTISGMKDTGKILSVSIQKIKFWSVLILFSILATFIDPFGLAIYTEAFTHIGNTDLKYVAEYVPFEDLSNRWRYMFITGSLLSFAVAIFFFSEKILKKIPLILVVFLLFIFAITVKRFAWPFYYTTPALLTAYFSFQKKDGLWSKVIGIIIILSALGFSLSQNNPVTVFKNANWNSYCKAIDCTVSSAEFLKKNTVPQPLWTNYNWGGYLIWNYPEVKPAIDGRMHLWRDEKGYSAFDEYYALESGGNIDKSRFNSAYVWKQKEIYKTLAYLEKIGKWKRIYEDSSAVIFIRQ